MAQTELHGNSDGYVSCPPRGDVPLEWCAVCPNLFRVENRGERAVVVCTADPRPARPWPDAPHVHDELVELAVGRAPLCWREGSRHGLTDEAF